MGAVEEPDSTLIGRLNDFFIAGENTDVIGNFFSQKRESLMKILEDEFTTDSQLGLEAYAMYQEYSRIIEEIIKAFMKSESIQGRSLTDEEVAKLILELVENPTASLEHLCVDYIAGQLDFKRFLDLAADMCSLLSAEWEGEDEEHEEEYEEEYKEDDTV